MSAGGRVDRFGDRFTRLPGCRQVQGLGMLDRLLAAASALAVSVFQVLEDSHNVRATPHRRTLRQQ
jgi:hypothetical protein